MLNRWREWQHRNEGTPMLKWMIRVSLAVVVVCVVGVIGIETHLGWRHPSAAITFLAWSTQVAMVCWVLWRRRKR
jgi:hypothetical protein